MPALTRFARLAASARTRGLVLATLRSRAARDAVRRAVTDPGGLVRDIRDPIAARRLLGKAGDGQSLIRIARAGLVFLPFRYLPAGYVATWAGGRVLRHIARRNQPRGTAPIEPRARRIVRNLILTTVIASDVRHAGARAEPGRAGDRSDRVPHCWFPRRGSRRRSEVP